MDDTMPATGKTIGPGAYLDKVVAFVTRARPDARELFVFRHPTAGVQLPAGTVEPNEAPDAAVLREVREETGLTNVAIESRLETLDERFSSGQKMLRQWVRLHVGSDTRSSALGCIWRRGVTVTIVDERKGYAKVIYEERDPRLPGDAAMIRCHARLPSSALTSRLRRHLYHLRSDEPTPDTWTIRSDLGHQFRLFWVPLSASPGLVSPQDAWLGRVVERLAGSRT